MPARRGSHSKWENVFQPMKRPTTTYVKRDQGQYEDKLENYLRDGEISVLSGLSKTGKTTLYRAVSQKIKMSPAVVRCDDKKTTDDIWNRVLEMVGAETITTIRKGGSSTKGKKISTKIEPAIPFLLSFFVKAGVNKSTTVKKIEEKCKYIGPPNPDKLKSSKRIIVIEDSHFLSEEVKRTLFLQCKFFADEHMRLILVATQNHESDIAYYNPDLIGRAHILHLPSWNVKDLRLIAEKGFKFLKIEIEDSVLDLIANESMGLPFLTQLVCRQVLKNHYKHLNKRFRNGTGVILYMDVKKAMNQIACEPEYSSIFDRLIKKDSMDYDIWAKMLSSFAFNPLKFTLTWDELRGRMAKLQDFNSEDEQVLKTMLITLKTRMKNKMHLLEWEESSRKVTITEPMFLFYLRWREIKQRSSTIETLAQEIYDELTKS